MGRWEGIWVGEIRYSAPSPVHTYFLWRIFVPASSLPGKLCPQVCKGLTLSCHSDLSSNVTSFEVDMCIWSHHWLSGAGPPLSPHFIALTTVCNGLVPLFMFLCLVTPPLLSCNLQGTLSAHYCQEQCLVQSRHPINIFEWVNEKKMR